MHHLDNREAAERLAGELTGPVRTHSEVVIAELSAVVGGHVGPGTIGVVIALARDVVVQAWRMLSRVSTALARGGSFLASVVNVTA